MAPTPKALTDADKAEARRLYDLLLKPLPREFARLCEQLDRASAR